MHISKRLPLVATLFATVPAFAATAHEPGATFKDCKDCPEMVVLPAGTFTMGTPEDEVGRQPDEGPQHEVTFARPFAVGKFQVLAKEMQAWQREAKVTLPDGDDRPGRRCRNGRPSYPQGPEQPAVCLSYHDAQAYVSWLSKKTGKHYRLLSEAEREYAARAGSRGPFPFPFDEGKAYSIAQHANTYGAADGYNHTSPAGAFAANAFGVHDMHGNVYEWVADCWHDNYEGAPSDGSAWMQGSCKDNQIRGNDYSEAPVFSRSGNRNNREPDERGDWLGLRVAREL